MMNRDVLPDDADCSRRPDVGIPSEQRQVNRARRRHDQGIERIARKAELVGQKITSKHDYAEELARCELRG